jgi:regulator of sirC expression with transglutaminase-like and TPR domain
VSEDARAAAERRLRAVAEAGDSPFDLAEAALALASLERPGVDLARYRHHLDLLAQDTGEAARGASDAAERAAAIAEAMFVRAGYSGDALTYDDLQNANLIRVIDRRKGLPVALGILVIHAGRAQGWSLAGLAFPGHFLVRLEGEGERAIIDPFHGGRICRAAELRKLLKATGGGNAELSAEYYATVSDREILVRLQNNSKLRLMKAQRAREALDTIERMLLFAPEQAALWHEKGLLDRHLGNMKAAIAAFETCLVRSDDVALRHRTAALLQQLRSTLN